jgi:hypothetical protein
MKVGEWKGGELSEGEKEKENGRKQYYVKEGN